MILKKKIFGGDNPRMGGDMSPPSPPGFTPMKCICITVRSGFRVGVGVADVNKTQSNK